jgi:serine/threonine-protein kinase RsbW
VLRIPTDNTADLERIHAWLETEVPGISKSILHAMQVALEEVVTNLVAHGFPPGISGEINLQVNVSAEEVVLVVEDHGRPFDPTTVPVPERGAALADVEPGGLGLTLMRHFCKDTSYRRVYGANRLTMRFPLS